MKIGELNGFEFHVPTSGGKAGKGCNHTGTIQVVRTSHHGSQIVKQFRFVVQDQASRLGAIVKARQYAKENV